MRLRAPGGATALLGNGLQLTKNPDWANIGVPWTHCWDMADAELYVPDAAEQSQFAITSAPRVSSVPDRGTGNKPLERSFGVHGEIYGAGTLPLPGPAYIPTSRRFRGRPAVNFDETPFTGVFSMLTPTQDWTTDTDYFNSPTGILPPYWFVVICRPKGVGTSADAPFDCVGSGGDVGLHAGPTLAAGIQSLFATGGENWTCSCWDDRGGGLAPWEVITSDHPGSVNETVMLVVRVKEGEDESNLWSIRRSTRGRIISNNGFPFGTLDANPLKEMFFGWLHTSYMSHAGIMDADIGFAELGMLYEFADQVVGVPGAIPTEP